MKHLDFQILAPGIEESPWSEAEALGSAVWLWMHSSGHRDAPLHTLNALLMPAIKHRQFLLASLHEKPVFYVAWANLSDEAEYRYLTSPAVCMRDTDWISGPRMWILDWIAPFGHTRVMRDMLQRRQLVNCCGRFLYHRSDHGVRVKTFHGIGVRTEEARAWLAAYPLMLPRPSG